MEKKLPQRMCIACREKKDKKSLIRVVCNKEGEISLDFTGKKAGRGAYICNDINCINKLIKNKLLNEAFETSVSEETYENIKNEFESKV